MKKCTKCGEEKPLSEFHKQTKIKCGYRSVCKSCRTIYNLLNKEARKAWTKKYREENKEKISLKKKEHYLANRKSNLSKGRFRKYGISEETYQTMLDDQRGICAICGLSMDKPHVDHDHNSGKVRALLCGNCNTAIGLLKESIQTLESAIQYLQYHNSED